MSDKIEEAEVDAYMDAENHNGEGPDKEERISYLKARLDFIREEYRKLALAQEEAQGTGRMDLLGSLRDGFRKNYSARKWIVKTLRSLGEAVEDKFIAG